MPFYPVMGMHSRSRACTKYMLGCAGYWMMAEINPVSTVLLREVLKAGTVGAVPASAGASASSSTLLILSLHACMAAARACTLT